MLMKLLVIFLVLFKRQLADYQKKLDLKIHEKNIAFSAFLVLEIHHPVKFTGEKLATYRFWCCMYITNENRNKQNSQMSGF